MDERYDGKAIGIFEADSLVACFMGLDAAAKTADIMIQGVERNRLKSGACVKMRGTISDVEAAMEAAVRVASEYGKITASHVIASPTPDTDIAMKMTINK